ncbi:MAG: nuclear transport factor 2 family protein [Oxalobacteraceae bacterium]
MMCFIQNKRAIAIAIAIAIALSVAQPVVAEECQPLRVEEVLAAEQLRLSSQMQKDLDTMSALLDEDLVYIRNSAVVDSKTSYLESMRKGDTVYERIEHTNDIVRTYGCTAILTGQGQYDVRINQKPLKLILRYHSVWQKRNGQLKLISWQATRVP